MSYKSYWLDVIVKQTVDRSTLIVLMKKMLHRERDAYLDIEELVVIEVGEKCIISGKTSGIQKANLPEINMEFEEILNLLWLCERLYSTCLAKEDIAEINQGKTMRTIVMRLDFYAFW